MNNIRNLFPFFKNNKEIIYFDNAATTQKPKVVIDEIKNYYSTNCYNIGRGKYLPALQLGKKIDDTRWKISDFINAEDKNEVYFVPGSSMASYLLSNIITLIKDDEIILCYNDHKSTITPWIEIAKSKEIRLKEILIDKEGDYNEEDLFNKINQNTKIVILTHIHNVYGLEMNIEYIVENIRKIKKDVIIILNATQSIAHIKVDVKKLNVDVIYFSGHKMFAETGIGVVWMKKQISKLLNIERIFFERGTLNISGILSIARAIDFIENIGINNIENYIQNLTIYLVNQLKKIEEIEFNKGPGICKCAVGYGIISFFVQGFNVDDISEILSDKKIFIRADRQCLFKNDEESIRVSLQIYNTKEEIDRFIVELKKIIDYRV